MNLIYLLRAKQDHVGLAYFEASLPAEAHARIPRMRAAVPDEIRNADLECIVVQSRKPGLPFFHEEYFLLFESAN